MTRPVSVSVVVPNYNYGDTLGLCLAALRQQTHPPLEILVADDGSTDDSVSVAESYGATVLSSGGHGGAAKVRNLGAAHARGDLLLFVDSDVAVPPDTIEKVVAVLVAEPGVGAICGMYEPEPLVRDSLVQECRAMQAYYWRISSAGSVSFLFSAICGMRTEVFAEMGPFLEGLPDNEEVEYGQRLSQRYEVRLTSAIRGRHRDDALLWPLLKKIFRRSRLRVPLYAQRRRFAQGYETPARVLAAAAAALAVPAVALPVLLGPVAAVVPLGLLAASVLCDASMYRYALGRRGLPFTAVFAGVQFLLNLATVAGVGVGTLQFLLSPRFRRLYDLTRPAGVPGMVAGAEVAGAPAGAPVDAPVDAPAGGPPRVRGDAA